MNIIRHLLLSALILALSSCTHYQNIRENDPRLAIRPAVDAYVRIHVLASYKVLFCNPQNTDECIDAGLIRGPVLTGSGGIISHTPDSTIILTAAHVVAGTGEKPLNDLARIARFFDQLAKTYGVSKEEVFLRVKNQHIKFEGVESKILVIASDGDVHTVSSMSCHKTLDICAIKSDPIEGVEPLAIAEHSPSIGDRVIVASGPFGHAQPGQMVPIFEGLYSGTIQEEDDIASAQSYYTAPSTPGASGSLILNSEGKIVGIVSKFVSGPFCPDNLPCQVLSASITISLSYSAILEFYLDQK